MTGHAIFSVTIRVSVDTGTANLDPTPGSVQAKTFHSNKNCTIMECTALVPKATPDYNAK